MDLELSAMDHDAEITRLDAMDLGAEVIGFATDVSKRGS
jgi:hypothetical protein